ncbi:hypothetical protein AB0N81_41790 [Streptomyces sp. NPDC093510]|uniref:hypothetical protein n=1 Tax=Streptomyces sp. NPDC093510 TaxID=3155199 RepID=UPI00341DF608
MGIGDAEQFVQFARGHQEKGTYVGGCSGADIAAARQRLGVVFLLLTPDRSRIVIEVDGVQHYADATGKASPRIYSERVGEDRRLHLLTGYDIYGFGGHELARPNAATMLHSLFGELLSRHKRPGARGGSRCAGGLSVRESSRGARRWCPTLYSADQLQRHLGDALHEFLDFIADRPDGLDTLAGGAFELPVEVEAVRLASRLQARDASHHECQTIRSIGLVSGEPSRRRTRSGCHPNSSASRGIMRPFTRSAISYA